MIKWYSVQSKISGFAFFPLLEMGVGVFLMICSIAVPVLFLVYNGLKPEQWGELLFCALFLALFLFMGKSLTFQSMKVMIEDEKYHFFQNLREPPSDFFMNKKDFHGFSTRDVDEGGEIFIVLYLKDSGQEKEFYRSNNRKEIKKISEALIELGKNG